ncbi:ROK family transcriptional regulator [Tessaracoccus palaemonis]|uniref:ROK family transcriptional regulator n=1 Tax=Tessaracoccus palaemonis TaxID=2829499 RepID=A0ABX8SKY2_9ACTN|nr:ROK family transcriptional regulator [Tessaracoccus palaemonis]QXT63310.1 ROK family transcriptional regulator [Tessaracoccus palaemonis]
MIDGIGARGSQSSLREANSAAVVEAVRQYGQITQVELAAVTGLSPATVSNLVKTLQSAGVVQTTATVRSGRRAQAVSLVRSSDLSVGVHIGRRRVEVIVADASWTVNANQHLPLPLDHRDDTTLDRIALLVGELTEQVGASLDDVAAVGLTMPGVGGAVYEALTGWEQIDVADQLTRILGRRVVAVPEAEAAAVAEARYGALRGVGSALVVRASSTTTSSLVVGGQPLQGLGVAAGALGHVSADASGRICRCGARGCLNTVASHLALADLLRVTHGPLSLRAIVQRANDGDPGCRQVVSHAATAIGTAIADAATLLAPERICLTGALTATGDLFTDAVRAVLRTRPLLPSGKGFVVVGECEDAEARGALAAASDGMDPLRSRER